MTDKTSEKQFQNDILQSLLKNGKWMKGSSQDYNQKFALYPEDLIGFVEDTQPEEWKKFTANHPTNTKEAFLQRVTEYLDKVGDQPSNDQMRRYGTLGVLRHPIKDIGTSFYLCRFQPDHNLNPDTLISYQKNRFRVVPELAYSPNVNDSGRNYRIDFVFFVNGIPVITMELKSEFKQAIEDAILQYKKTRLPKDPVTNKLEPLLKFKRGAIVHFAVSQTEVYMTTKLAGDDTVFLPFNKGTKDGGAGNDIPESGYATAYLWEEILDPDNLLKILGRYIHLKIEDLEDYEGKKYKKESIIFPRYHQWNSVEQLIKAVKNEGVGNRYLIQHSAGSGKSNSIAWLAHQLASLYQKSGDKYFRSVIVITDRTLLDSQLQDTIYQFEHSEGMISKINRKEGSGSKSDKLRKALEKESAIIIVTIQTFPFVLEEIRKSTTLSGKNFAIIADEAHSSQSGRTATKVKEVLLAEEIDQEEISAEDMLALTLRAKEGKGTISYFAFTATPKDRTIQLFGRKPTPDSLPEPFHVYTMKQAIEEGFILDVLCNYINYNEAYKLTLKNDEVVDKDKAGKAISKWVKIHPTVISQKIQIIIEHFREHVRMNLSGQAKAMVVTGSRLEAVTYKLAFDEYIKEKNYKDIRTLVAFSGEVKHEDLPENTKPYTENNLNSDLKGKDIRGAFDTEEYNILLVANKFQTGFDQPKLCAMYINKKVAGIECVQTFSRLNRTYPGKSKHEVYILDFVNDSETIIESFQPYYKKVHLTKLSNPNEVYDLMDKLNTSGIYEWSEVEEFVKVYFDKSKKQDDLIKVCMPIVSRWREKYKDTIENIKLLNSKVLECKKKKDTIGEQNFSKDIKEYERKKGELELFKRELGVFTRYYEFISQVFIMSDLELEKLSLFARNLQELLKTEVLSNEIDLSGIEMKNYRLSQLRKKDLKLENTEGEIDPTQLSKPHIKETEKVWLSDVINRINELFGNEFGDKEILIHTYAIVEKVKGNQTVIEQIRNNPIDQVLHGDLPEIVDNAIIELEKISDKNKDIYLGDKEVRTNYIKIIFELIKKQLDDTPTKIFADL